MTHIPQAIVVMPCFNAAEFVASAIESVLAQTHRDFILAIVDDGSSDATVDIIRAYQHADARVKLIQQPNSGPSAARNRGIACVDSKYIALIDSDDIWLPHHLEENLDRLEADSALGVSFAACSYISHRSEPLGTGSRIAKQSITKRDLLSGNPTTTCSSLVFRRQAFQSAGPFRTDMKLAEDQEWLFRLVNAGWRIEGSDSRTVRYRVAASSLSSQTDKMKAGWQQFILIAEQLDPDLVKRERPRAEAVMNLYWARRALSGKRCTRSALGYLADAFRSSPIHTLERIAASAHTSMRPSSTAATSPVIAN